MKKNLSFLILALFCFIPYVGAQILTSPTSLDFPAAVINVKNTEKIKLSGQNLTGDLTVKVSNASFSLSTTTLSKEALQRDGGTELEVYITPKGTTATYSGTITITGGGIATRTIKLTATKRDLYVTGPAFGGFSNSNPEKFTLVKGKLIWSGFLVEGEFKFPTLLGTWKGCFDAYNRQQALVADGSTPHYFYYVPGTDSGNKFYVHNPGYYTIAVDMANKSFTVQNGVYNAADVTTIVCIGNGITEGYGISTKATDSYPAILGKSLGESHFVYNMGIVGTTLQKNGHKPYRDQPIYEAIKNSKLDTVIISFGADDVRNRNLENGFNAENFKNDLKEMVAELSQQTPKPAIFLSTPTYIKPEIPELGTSADYYNGTVLRDQLVPAIRDVAKELSLPCIDFYELTYERDRFYSGKVNLSVSGAKALGEYVNEIFRKRAMITGPMTLNFPAAIVNVKNTEKIRFTGVNLTEDATISVSSGAFSISKTTVTKEELMQPGGVEVEVNITPQGSTATYSGIVSINAGTGGIRNVMVTATRRDFYVTGPAFGGFSNSNPKKFTLENGKLIWSGVLVEGEFKFPTKLGTWEGCFDALKRQDPIVADGVTPHRFTYIPSTASGNKFYVHEQGYYSIEVDIASKSFTIKKGLPKKPNTKRVVVIGTSIASGYRLANPTLDCFPSVMAIQLGSGYEVLNLAVDGATMQKSGHKPYWDQLNYDLVKTSNADIVILKLGMNDTRPMNWVSNEINSASFERDMKDMISELSAMPTNPKIYVGVGYYIEPKEVESTTSGFNGTVMRDYIVPITRKVVRESANVDYLEYYELTYKWPISMAGTGLHPTVAGAKEMADYTYKILAGKPVVTSPEKIEYSFVATGTESTAKATVTARNLTGDLTATISGTDFSFANNAATIVLPRESVEKVGGYEFAVSFKPMTLARTSPPVSLFTGYITISGGGVPDRKISLSGTATTPFALNVTQNQEEITDISTIDLQDTKIYSHEKQVVVELNDSNTKVRAQLISTTGMLIDSVESESKIFTLGSNLPEGVYIVRLISNNAKSTHKVLVK